jgi:hypothetical protein
MMLIKVLVVGVTSVPSTRVTFGRGMEQALERAADECHSRETEK